MLKEIKFALCAAAVGCAALSGFADSYAGVTNDFETAMDPFIGEGSLASNNEGCAFTNSTKLAKVGNPIEGDHTQFLCVEGEVVCSNVTADLSTTAQSRTLDFLMAAEEFDEDGLPDVSEDAQFRLAFGADGKLNLLCTPSNNDGLTNWVEVTDAIPSGTWVRVTMNIKYGASGKAMAQLIVDGNPCSTVGGWADTNKTAAVGTWYEAATDGTALSRVEFSGIGGVDDFVLRETPASAAELPGATEEVIEGVESGWLIDNGIAAEQINEPSAGAGGTGYTNKQAHDAGIDPKGTTPLYVEDAVIVSNSLVFTVNGYKGDAGTSYTLKSSTSPITATNAGTTYGVGEVLTTGNSETKTTSATVPIPDNDVTYFQVVASGTVTTTNQFGLMRIMSPNATTIISAPWVSLDSNVASPAPMTVDKLVQIDSNLEDGDLLILYDASFGGTGYKTWQVSGREWVGVSTYATPEEGQIESPVGQDTTNGSSETLARGQGIMLYRHSPTNTDGTAKSFYVYGQYIAAAADAPTITSGSTKLLASPNPDEGYTLSKITPATDAQGVNGDKVIVPTISGSPRIYTHDGTSWGYEQDTTPTTQGGFTIQNKVRNTTDTTITKGQGFWYKSKSGGTAPTVTW